MIKIDNYALKGHVIVVAGFSSFTPNNNSNAMSHIAFIEEGYHGMRLQTEGA